MDLRRVSRQGLRLGEGRRSSPLEAVFCSCDPFPAAPDERRFELAIPGGLRDVDEDKKLVQAEG